MVLREGPREAKKKAITFEDLEFWGVGVLGLRPDEFWDLTFREYIIKWRGYQQRQEEWERVIRLQTYYTISPHLKDKIEPFDLWTLPSEVRAKEAEQERQAKEAERLFLNLL